MAANNTAPNLNEMCSMRICVDRYENEVLIGRLCNSYYEKPIPFSSTISLLKIMDSIFDHFEYPQRSIETRSFSEEAKKDPLSNTPVLSSPVQMDEGGQLNTFYVKVIFRKHATWQGSISSISDKSEYNFRSVLEMLLLIDSSLVKKNVSEN